MKNFDSIFFMTLVMLVFTLGLPFIVLRGLINNGPAEAFGKEARTDLRRVYGEYFDLFKKDKG